MKRRKTYCVYIMGSLSGTLYIGMSSTLYKRVFMHKNHLLEGFTAQYKVDRLLYVESFDDVHKAIAREKQLKGWRRDRKIALFERVNPHWVDLAKDWYPETKPQFGDRGASTTQSIRFAPAPAPLSMTILKVQWQAKHPIPHLRRTKPNNQTTPPTCYPERALP